jgi:IclR family transcriptional regulator, KDG regulon repressor
MGQFEKNIQKADTGVLAHICEILDCFSQEHVELGVREIARLSGISTSTTGRLLLALKERGILQQNPEMKTYSLGIRLLNWSGVYLASLDIRAISMPIMTELLRLTQETISLYILDGTDRVCVERLESPQSVRIVARLGLRLPLYAGSAGKVILAFLPEEKRENIITSVPLQPFTRHTIADSQVLREELEKIRKRGFAYSHGEWIQDASGVAAPIYGPDRIVIGALTISGPSQRFTRDVIEKYGREAVPAASEISRLLGFSSKPSYVQYRK